MEEQNSDTYHIRFSGLAGVKRPSQWHNVVAKNLQHEDLSVVAPGLSSCGPWASLLLSKWDLSSPTGIKPEFPGPCGSPLASLLIYL